MGLFEPRHNWCDFTSHAPDFFRILCAPQEGLRTTYAAAVKANCATQAEVALLAWISWARRSRLEPFKKLATTVKERLPGIVRDMLDGRSNAYVEAMNGMLQQTKRAARGFRTIKNFVAIAYLRMSKLKHLPINPLRPATSRNEGITSITRYRDGKQYPQKTAESQNYSSTWIRNIKCRTHPS